MKKIIILNLILCVFFITSCTSDNYNKNNQRKLTSNSISIAQIYQNVIDDENPMGIMDKFPNSIKAELWRYKYNLFKSQHNLDSIQMHYLNRLSDFVYQAQIEQGYDKTAAKQLNTYIIGHFTPNQAMDLVYYIDNPSSGISESNCFWCSEVVSQGPCEIKERPDGSQYLGRDGQVQRYRFGIRWGAPRDVDYIPCDWEDWLNDHQ